MPPIMSAQRTKICKHLSAIVAAAEKHGTLQRLSSVAIYFSEAELRTIIHALQTVDTIEKEHQ